MFDVANNTKLQSIIEKIYESDGVVGGHGSASIVNVKLSDGEYLVKGKKMLVFQIPRKPVSLGQNREHCFRS